MAVNRSGGGNRPVSRERNTSSGSGRSVERRGGGLNLGGPVGNSGGYEGRPGTGGREGGGAGFLWFVFLVVLICFVSFSDGAGISGIFENIIHQVQGISEGIDTDEVAERFSGLLENAGQGLGLLEKDVQTADSRSVVQQFTGVLSGGDGIVDALERSGGSYESGGGAIDASRFTWSTNSSGQRVLKLTDDEWDLIDTVKLNVFVDDGEGFIDLGLDPLFDFDENGDLIGEYDGTWLAIDRQPVAFYHLTTIEDGEQYRIIGYVPAFLNDSHANLILVFDNANPKGYIAGAKVIENGPGTDLSLEEMVSGLITVNEGDKLDFVCDYYDYDGVFINNYFFGESMTLSKDPEISNVKVPGTLSACYRLEDIYGSHYWTPLMD